MILAVIKNVFEQTKATTLQQFLKNLMNIFFKKRTKKTLKSIFLDKLY